MRCQNCKTYIPEGIALDKCPACNTSIAPNNPSGLSQSAVSSLDLMKVLRGSMPYIRRKRCCRRKGDHLLPGGYRRCRTAYAKGIRGEIP